MDRNKPMIALDFQSKEEAKHFLEAFGHQKLTLKIGMELFYSSGPNFVKELVTDGHDIFLDLKLYDIPHTVKKAMTQLAELGVQMVNVHAAGGQEMMEAAKEGLEAGTKEGIERPLLIAVTQLTSRDEATTKEELQLTVSQKENILHLAKLTEASGLDGVVCSPLEAQMIKENTSEEFLTVTPGIRLNTQNIQADDQVRVTTPKEAAEIGSDYIVVGRPITLASNPFESYQSIEKEWQDALKERKND